MTRGMATGTMLAMETVIARERGKSRGLGLYSLPNGSAATLPLGRDKRLITF